MHVWKGTNSRAVCRTNTKLTGENLEVVPVPFVTSRRAIVHIFLCTEKFRGRECQRYSAEHHRQDTD